jgi:hypothetical protein
MFIVLVSYFDGGGKADSTQYDHLTLAALAGKEKHWRSFNSSWRKVLRKHGVDYLHTTDAMSLQGIYKQMNEDSVDDLINDCVAVIQKHTAPERFRDGIRAITTTVVLKDLLRAFEENPSIGTAEEHCAVSCFNAVLIFGQGTGCATFECYFDQGENFCGFIRDRISNRASRKNDLILDSVHVDESDMRKVPALQAADLYAWAVNDAHRVLTLRPWQDRLLVDTYRTKDLADYHSFTQDLIPAELEKVRSWKMPRRRRPR